jgi:lysophospholipase L1-like esterase
MTTQSTYKDVLLKEVAPDGIAKLDEESQAVLNASGYGPLAAKISAAYQSARNNSPLDLAVMASPPTVTVGAAAITNGQAYNYFDTDGYKRIRIKGVPFGDTSVMCENVAGYLRGVNVGNSGGSFAAASNAKHYLCEVTFTGQIIQFVLNGLSAGLIRFRVNGALVSASATTVGNSNVQLDFGSTVYNKTIAMEFEQSQTVKGVVVGPNDTICAVDAPPLPIVVTGDSYTQGTTSPATFGAETFCGCLRDASGLNVLALGVASAGYIKAGVVNMTNAQWLAKVVAATNAASAPVILIPFGTNDYGLDAAAIQAAATAVGSAFLSGTAAKVVFMGPWPQNRNNDANSLAVEAAIQAAAASLDQSRVGFIPVCSGSNPWVKGQGDNDTAPNGTTVAYGNSAIVTGNDGVHPYPGRGSEYLARKTIDALISLCDSKGW